MKNKIMLGLATLAVAANSAMAQAADPNDLATDAETLFNTVSGITIAVVGFYILIRIVKRVSKA